MCPLHTAMDRRRCLKLALGAASAWIARPAWAGAGSVRDNLGIQTFTVRDLLAQDTLGTLSALADIGYRELEMVGFGGSPFLEDPLYGYSPREFKALLDDLGLRVPSTQYSSQTEELAEIADTVQQIGVEYMVLGMATDFLSITPDGPVVSGVTGRDQIMRLADHLNDVAELWRRSGLGFGYHNHNMEFVRVGDRLAYDLLVEHTDPALVKLELDAGWTKVAGVDAHVYLERYPGRFMACHLKDFDPRRPLGEPSPRSPIPEMTQLVAPGGGTVDFARLLAAMERTGVPHGFVEVDLPDAALEAARGGYQYLEGLSY